MAKRQKPPVTAAVRVLRRQGVAFTDHLYDYQDKGGAQQGARELGVSPHCVVKTLIMENDRNEPLVMLMHGDREVSTKELARLLNVKSIQPCDPATADRHSGYRVGGTSPFGTRRPMPVYMEAGILDLPRIYINGGKRGYLLGLDPRDARRVLEASLVRVAVPHDPPVQA